MTANWKEKNRNLKESLDTHFDFGDIIGRSPSMRELFETLAQVAPSEATVLIQGESGTGKELVADAIHLNSPRKGGPFVKVNCAALRNAAGKRTFRPRKGAFTGAIGPKEGTVPPTASRNSVSG